MSNRHTVVVENAQMELLLKSGGSDKLKTAISNLQLWRREHERHFNQASHRNYTRALTIARTTARLIVHWDIMEGALEGIAGYHARVDMYQEHLARELNRADSDFYK